MAIIVSGNPNDSSGTKLESNFNESGFDSYQQNTYGSSGTSFALDAANALFGGGGASINEEDEVRQFLARGTSSTLDGTVSDVIYGDKFDLNALMCAPFKFSDNDDPAVSDDAGEYGRTYVEQFMSWGNIVTISPGIATFLPGMSDEKKAKIMSDMVTTPKESKEQLNTAEVNAYLEEEKAGKMYDFIPANRMYWDYVNSIWRHMIALSGLSGYESRLAAYYGTGLSLGAIVGSTKKLEDIEWKGVNSSSVMNRLLYGSIGSSSEQSKEVTQTFVPFYHDGPFNISEASSNSSGESAYASKINQIPGDEIARELGFLTGVTYADTDEYDKNAKNQKNSNGAIEKMMSLKTFGVKTIIPEVWKGSDSHKEITLNFKCASTSGTPDAYALNDLRPLAHWLAMALPIHSKGNYAYGAPMLCRLYAKGMPNIDIGMVTNIQITKNIKTISTFGLACDMDITVTIRDMTPIIALPYSRRGFNASSAIGYMNLIGGLTGANVSLIDWKNLNLFMDTDSLRSFISPTNIARTFSNAARDFAGKGKVYLRKVGNIANPWR